MFDPKFAKAERVNVMVAGFPCQGYSDIGLKMGPDDPQSDAPDCVFALFIHRCD